MHSKTTASLKPAEVEKKWIVIDAENAVVGRLATFIAMRLRGKHRADYTPHVDCGDFVVVINADKVKFTGRKLDRQDLLLAHRPPGRRSRSAPPARSSAASFPERMLEKAVERMLPKESPLARKQMTPPAHLRRRRASARRPEPRNHRVRRAERQERPERLSMTRRPNGFEALQAIATPTRPTPRRPAEPKLDAQGRAYATGKRKNAIARVWIKPGKGKITINGRDQEIYFARPVLRMMIAQPLQVDRPPRPVRRRSSPSRARACRARPARSATASPRR